MRIECVWGMHLKEDWARTVEIDRKTPLLSVHYLIQKLIGFDDDHLFEFFSGRHTRDRKAYYGEPYADREGCDLAEVALDQAFPLPKRCKLFYHFDFGDDWYFAITKSRKGPREPEPGVQYPRVIETVGPNPSQYGPPEE